MERIETKCHGNILHYTQKDREYPDRLRHIQSPPKDLYVMGQLPDPHLPAVAIVGARNATPYGYETAVRFARELASNGVQIISGFARGIDRAGHEGALRGDGRTFAVLGNGVDICYPRENIDLYRAVAEGGGFLSEFAPGTEPRARFFPMRNRIISALADLILVVEAREKSGSLITADFGLEQGKDIYAVPGRLCDTVSSGCNRLISQGAGIAISSVNIMEVLDIKNPQLQSFGEKNKNSLALEEETVYSCIRLQPKSTEQLLKETKMSIAELTNILIGLELKNLIKETGRNYYVRND